MQRIQSIEYLGVELKYSGKYILVGVCYGPPSNLINIRTTSIEDFKTVFENMKQDGYGL